MVVTIGKIPKLVKKEYRFKKRTKKTMPKLSSLDRKRAEQGADRDNWIIWSIEW